jgi:hypothetical protein
MLERTTPGRPTRWPFRLLAAVIVLAALVAVLGSDYSALGHGDLRAALTLLAVAPVTARLGGQTIPWTHCAASAQTQDVLASRDRPLSS